MIWFLAVAAVISLAVLAVLLRPLIRQPRAGAGEAEPVAALFRRQLAAIDEELADGRLPPDEAEAARTEITRRLLAAADRDEAPADGTARRAFDNPWRFGAALAIAGVLPAAALAVYFAVGAPTAIERNAAVGADPAAAHSTADLAAAADQIKAHLQKAPDDLKGWTLLGRTLASLGRFPEALDAYNHALALAPDNASLHAEFGEVLVLQAQGTVTPAAETEFAKAPDDPRSRYYGAEAALQHGDTAGAKRRLQALLADAPADAPWRQTVAARLAGLSPSAVGGAAAAPAGGPTAQDVAAAQSMTPEQRQAMIRGMVERLAQRLEQHPDDKAGWERLARAYDVLGEPDKAQTAHARAAAVGGEQGPASPAPAAVPTAVGPTAQGPTAQRPTAPGGAQVATAATPAPGATPTAARPASPPPPNDAQGWIDRARAYQGQGRTEDALAALKDGNAAFPANLPLLEAYMNALASGLKDDKPTAELVAAATQVNVLDAKQPDALWYLGIAAADNDDPFRAATYWTRLVAELPSGDPRRAAVQQRLDALH